MEKEMLNDDKKFDYCEILIIEKNESLFTIAKENNFNPSLLAILNGLDSSDYIFSGQKILIPKNNYSY